jgi:Ca2+-transporting ATPase
MGRRWAGSPGTSQRDHGPKGKPWAVSADEVISALDGDGERGLRGEEVKERRNVYGPNRLRQTKTKSTWLILADQFKSLIILLLAVAAVLSFLFGQRLEGLAIVAVILINAGIGFFTELKAVRSVEALRRLGSVAAKVRRDGEIREIAAENLVPGDLLIVEGGDVITADCRLMEASKLQADESALTGESLPVSKRTEPLAAETPVTGRANMLFKGTAATRGSGQGVVVATGMQTELGRISALVEEAKEEVTPLEKRLDRLGHKLIWLTLGIAAVIGATGILAGRQVLMMIETAIALAVAAIPEGLPIVATIALARGMWLMARRNALINKLSAVETLGATSVVFTDKTGTLTENRMTLARIALNSKEIEIDDGEFRVEGTGLDPSKDEPLKEFLRVGVLCSNASLGAEGEGKTVGDPLEVALLAAGASAGLRRQELVKEMPEAREEAFDSEVKMMATFHKRKDRYHVAVKGAPEAVLRASSFVLDGGGREELDEDRRQGWLARSDEMAGEGLRVLALARKEVDGVESDPYEALTFIGLAGLVDPPRKDVRGAIESCKQAGVRVIMVTGDQPLTARKIALAVGLIDSDEAEAVRGRDIPELGNLSQDERRKLLGASIFARVSPKQKLDLIEIHQKTGAVVAMTGDGVNDAPALKKADIGVAMGRRGTQVAREAADMVLKDDAFSSIVEAIRQGRTIFANIRNFVFYLLSCNVSEIMAVGLAFLAKAPLPILPLQILFLNLITDVFPAIALGLGEGDREAMERPPREPGEPILTNDHWLAIGGYGLMITAAVLGALALALRWLDMGERQAVTVSFLTLAFAQLWHVFNMRDRGSRLFRNEVTRNPFVWGALGLCVALVLLGVYLPGLSLVLDLVPPGTEGWLVVLGTSLIPLLVGQIGKGLLSVVTEGKK